MPFYEKDTEGKLVKVEDVPEEAVQLMDRFDGEAIVHRLTTGIASDAFIYRYPIKTKFGVKEIIGISTDGSYELATMLGNIEVLQDVKVDKDSDPDYFYAMVRAKDISRNVILLGVARQCKFMVDEGNKPIHDRLNEHAFVASISKAQRNAILHLTPEDVITKIINNWAQRGKSKQLRPQPLETEPTPPVTTKPPTAATSEFTATAAQVTEQQEKLKKLRMEVHNRFQADLGIGLEKRKGMLKEKFGVDSLTDLSEQQLNECKVWVEEMITQGTKAPPATKAPTDRDIRTNQAKELGFESLDEQNKLRGSLYTILTSPNQLGLKDEEAKEFVTKKGFTSTNSIPKRSLVELISEANEIIRIRQTPPPPGELEPENIPF
ncbi:hypothetical protein KKF82_08050 [Patescibacteria group bacterium]|uniref:Uncharacterized protein n=1 Tax=viral metagenome TaxID=1070528 RepID=A0A6M3MD02_9ZZZZ|nr:hypothetical protein [Patescibacteria group bacterium]